MGERQSQILASGNSGDSSGRLLLGWYDRHHRALPWRRPPGAPGADPIDPYRVWLSEIMLQQTQVDTVKPYFSAFVRRWPDVHALAGASLDEVLAAWAGLGYYSRARNLKRTAEIVARDLSGEFPVDAAGLRALPGIGDYTAAAIAAIAFGRPEAAVDGNVERVISRLSRIAQPAGMARRRIREQVRQMIPAERPGDFAQALMDLGATVCTPRRPACPQCPLRGACGAFAKGDPERFPARAPRRTRPVRQGAAFVAIRADGWILLRRRASRGVLAGMAEVPTSQWSGRCDGDTGVDSAPLPAEWRPVGSASHAFTHFGLELVVFRADDISAAAPEGCWWADPEGLDGEGLPSLFRKVIEAARAGPGEA